MKLTHTPYCFFIASYVNLLYCRKCFHFIIFFLITIFYQSSFAQFVKVNTDPSIWQRKITPLPNKKRIDSLNQLIGNAPDDTNKVMRLILLSNEQGYDFENATTEFAEKAKNLAEKLHYNWGLAMAYQAIGMIYQNNKKYTTAIAYYQQAIDAAKNNVDVLRNNFYSSLLNLYFYLGDYPNAMREVSSQLSLFEKIKNKPGIAHCNNLLGYIYFKQENLSEAEKYYSRYIANARELNDSIMIAHALGEVSDVYTEAKKYDQASNALFTAQRILDLTGKSFNKYNVGQVHQMRAKAMYRLGKIYKFQKNFSEALKFSLAAVDFSGKNSTTDYDVASYHINTGDVYKELKEYKKALGYLSFGFNLSKSIQHRENTRDAAEYLSQTYALEQKYDSALFYYHLFTVLKDSIVNNETKMKIAGVQGQYDVAKKDKEIVRQYQLRNILISGFVFLLISLYFIYNHYQLKQKTRYQQQHILQQNELFNAIAAAQDQERKRIAQDIHDSLGSILSAAKLKLSALNESRTLLSDEQAENYLTTMQLLDEASSELRSISHNIMPATLSKLGLIAALKTLSNTMSSHSGMQINFSAYYFSERIEEEKEMSIYRIVLELINNSVKHAQARKVTVQLIKYPDHVNLSVEDNGRGFDYITALRDKKGIGLGNILSRVNYMKGKMNVDALPGRGTTVIIDVPL